MGELQERAGRVRQAEQGLRRRRSVYHSVADPVLAKFSSRALFPKRWEISKILIMNILDDFANLLFCF